MAKTNKPTPLSEIGFTGLKEWSGQIREDFLRELQGIEGYKRYREMQLNSPIVGAMLLAIEQSIRGISWEFTSDIEDDPRIEFLDEALENMSHSWNDHIIEALTMLPFGFSPFEIVYERVGGAMLWRKFAIRGQDTVQKWNLDERGGIQGFQQQSPPTYNLVTLPIEKLILYRTRIERNNPEGRSILRTAWTSYYYLKNIMQIEAIGIERDLAGLPVIKMPTGASTGDESTSDASIAKKTVRNIRNDEQSGVVLPDGFDLVLLSTGGTRQFDTNEIVRRYENNILLSALAQFLSLGQAGIGSFALSKDQSDFFTMSVNATADIIAETFSKYPVPRLLKLNGMNTEGVKYEHTPAGDVDIGVISDFVQKMGSNITWSAEDELWARQVARLPERDLEVLEKERADKAEIAATTAAAFQRQPAPERDDNSAVTKFGADAPDDKARRKWERKWESELETEFNKSMKRVTKEAKK